MSATTKVREIMTTEVATLPADATAAAAADALAAGGYGAMPVVDADGHLVGVLRDRDLIVSEARVHAPHLVAVIARRSAVGGCRAPGHPGRQAMTSP